MRKKLETMKIGNYQNSVENMCTKIEELMEKIEGSGERCESIRRYVLTTLLSGPNSKFNRFIDRIQDDIKSGKGIHSKMTWQDIISSARTKFQNMESTGAWLAVDPPDACFLALTTQIQKLESQIAATKDNSGSGGTNNNGSYKIAEWRFDKKGDTPQRDGKKWWWCPKHNSGKGMYVRHPPEEHDDWERLKKSGGKYIPLDYRSSDQPSEESRKLPTDDSEKAKLSPKLELDPRLKEVLCTNLCLSEQDIDRLADAAGSM